MLKGISHSNGTSVFQNLCVHVNIITRVLKQLFGPWWAQELQTPHPEEESTLSLCYQDSQHGTVEWPRKRPLVQRKTCLNTLVQRKTLHGLTKPQSTANKFQLLLSSSKSFFNALQGSDTLKPIFLFQKTFSLSLHTRSAMHKIDVMAPEGLKPEMQR